MGSFLSFLPAFSSFFSLHGVFKFAYSSDQQCSRFYSEPAHQTRTECLVSLTWMASVAVNCCICTIRGGSNKQHKRLDWDWGSCVSLGEDGGEVKKWPGVCAGTGSAVTDTGVLSWVSCTLAPSWDILPIYARCALSASTQEARSPWQPACPDWARVPYLFHA